MKKILMTIAAAFVAVSMNAQGYIGGTVGFGTTTDKTGAVEDKTTSFVIAPEIGMSLDDKFGVGIAIGFGYDKHEAGLETSTTTFSLKPYLRYQALTFGKANIFVDGGIDFDIAKTKDMKAGMGLGLFVTPGIAYNISSKWSIVAKLNDMFRLGYAKSPVPDVNNAPDAPSAFAFNASTGGFRLGDLTFGVYYNF